MHCNMCRDRVVASTMKLSIRYNNKNERLCYCNLHICKYMHIYMHMHIYAQMIMHLHICINMHISDNAFEYMHIYACE